MVAETPWAAEARPRADAIVTKMRALAIGVTTADCGPILFADPKAGVIAAAGVVWLIVDRSHGKPKTGMVDPPFVVRF